MKPDPGETAGASGLMSASPEETERAGAALAAGLAAGDVVLVSGELGSGKTTFVRGAARALGVEGPVTSPTFTIGQLLAGRREVAHLDLYRLGSLAGEDPALLDDYLTPERIAFVEWPEAAEPALAGVVARVRLEHAGEGRRRITIELGERHAGSERTPGAGHREGAATTPDAERAGGAAEPRGTEPSAGVEHPRGAGGRHGAEGRTPSAGAP